MLPSLRLIRCEMDRHRASPVPAQGGGCRKLRDPIACPGDDGTLRRRRNLSYNSRRNYLHTFSTRRRATCRAPRCYILSLNSKFGCSLDSGVATRAPRASTAIGAIYFGGNIRNEAIAFSQRTKTEKSEENV